MVLYMMRIVWFFRACKVDTPLKDICIGIDSRVQDSCTDENGEYILYDLSERLYMIDVCVEVGSERQGHHKSFHFSFIKLDSKPDMVIPELSITHYIQCGFLESALLKNYVWTDE